MWKISNPFEAVWNILKTTIDNTDEPTSPLNIIEAGDCWTYILMLEEFLRYEEVGLNTTTDDEMNEMLTDVVRLCEGQSRRLKEFMKQEGIPLPNGPSPKPESQPQEVPLGVKLTDSELANGVALKLATCLQICAKAQADSLRQDIGGIWIGFFTEWVTFGSTLKTLMRHRGWINVPPYYVPPGSPQK
ncbi:DUF3231 family protein [Virgibacillus kekensis]|uniref:DUF3231 family protein n=1 Tax=Virgibacillus kekensis TaxID=202261 RepID=A0ABV9DJM7_9BACI